MVAATPSPSTANSTSHTTRVRGAARRRAAAVVSAACCVIAVRMVVSRFSLAGEVRPGGITAGRGAEGGAIGGAAGLDSAAGRAAGAVATSSASTAARSAASRSALGGAGGRGVGRMIVGGGNGSGRLAWSGLIMRDNVAPHAQVSVRTKPPPAWGAAARAMPPQPACSRPNRSTSGKSLMRVPRAARLRQRPLDGRDPPPVALGDGVDRDDFRQRRARAFLDGDAEVVPRVAAVDGRHALEAAGLHELVVEQADGLRLATPGAARLAGAPRLGAGLAALPRLDRGRRR